VLYDDRDQRAVRDGILSAAAVAWLLLVVGSAMRPDHAIGSHHHGQSMTGVSQVTVGAVNWLLMLVAMMSPVLIQPIQFVRSSGLSRRRTRTTLLFVIGYSCVWVAAGAPMLAASEWLASFGPIPGLQPAIAVVVGIVWQCSPVKQVSLNRCHVFYELAAFGRAADVDAFRFGVTRGGWCLSSCWAFMFVPLLLPRPWHVEAMAAAAVLIVCERLDAPAPRRWRWRGFGTAIRIFSQRLKELMHAPASSQPRVS
jgi:predicted metal-binding membrane protein